MVQFLKSRISDKFFISNLGPSFWLQWSYHTTMEIFKPNNLSDNDRASGINVTNISRCSNARLGEGYVLINNSISWHITFCKVSGTHCRTSYKVRDGKSVVICANLRMVHIVSKDFRFIWIISIVVWFNFSSRKLGSNHSFKKISAFDLENYIIWWRAYVPLWL